MKKFREHLSEDVVPAALVTNGTISLDDEDTRASVNMALAHVTSNGAITPYIALNKISKALAYFHIILPKRIYLEGSKGVEVHEIHQFGDTMGMTNQGEFVQDVPGKFYLFIQYRMNTGMSHGSQYARPTMGGTFSVFAKVVDKDELDKLVSMAELALAEECDAEMQQRKAKALAPKEPMHDITSDEKKKGNKEAVSTSEKKSLEEGRKASRNPAAAYGIRIKTPKHLPPKSDKPSEPSPTPHSKWRPLKKSTESDAEYDERVAKNRARQRASIGLEEEQIDEVSHKLALKAMKGSEKRADDEWEADAAYDRLSDWKTHDARAHRLRGHMKRKFGSKKIKTDGEDRLKDYDGYSGRGVHTVNTHGKRAGLPPKEEVHRIKRSIKFSLGKHHKPNLPEETQIDELNKSTLGSYVKKAGDSRVGGAMTIGTMNSDAERRGYAKKDEIKRGGDVLRKMKNRRIGTDRAVERLTKEETQIDEISKELAGRYIKKASKNAAYGQRQGEALSVSINGAERREGGRILKKSYKRLDAVDTATDKLTGKAKVHAKEETLSELSKDTLKSYKKAAESDKKSAERSADVSRSNRKDRALPLKSRIAHGNEEKWLKGIAKKREKGIAMADKRLEEKAPPGREKQVLALKKKFPKGSGSPFAIAWSSYNKSHQKEELKFDPASEIPKNN